MISNPLPITVISDLQKRNHFNLEETKLTIATLRNQFDFVKFWPLFTANEKSFGIGIPSNSIQHIIATFVNGFKEVFWH
jgi:hypothetical protein